MILPLLFGRTALVWGFLPADLPVPHSEVLTVHASTCSYLLCVVITVPSTQLRTWYSAVQGAA